MLICYIEYFYVLRKGFCDIVFLRGVFEEIYVFGNCKEYVFIDKYFLVFVKEKFVVFMEVNLLDFSMKID